MKTFLRPGSIPIHRSVEGYGTPPGIEDYPFQGLDIETDPYDPWSWLSKARYAAQVSKFYEHDVPTHGQSGYCKYQGENWLTPLGTPVAQLTREGPDMLTSTCGLCASPLTACTCAFPKAANE